MGKKPTQEEFEKEKEEFKTIQQFEDVDDRSALKGIMRTSNCQSIKDELKVSRGNRDRQKVECMEAVNRIKSEEYKKWYNEKGYECTKAQQKAKLVEIEEEICAKKNCGCEYPKKK